MKAGFAKAIMILFGGAFVGYLVKEVNPYFITGTTVAENMYTYLITFAIFVALIIAAFFAVFRNRTRKPKL